MASGVDIVYPPEHRQLADRIVGSGALISDYPPGTKPDAPNFPARNRIISGLSLATIVVEAPTRSGALITVGFAADQGRDVYAVPGSILSNASGGTNKLLRQGATPLTCAADLLEDLQLAPTLPVDEPSQPTFPMTDGERAIYALVTSEPQHIDELAYSVGVTISQASALMTMLELKGLVANAGAQHFVATSVRPKSRRARPS
jgi:DNA processing protein